jgi:hypothetical protein
MQEFLGFRVLGSTLRMKVQVDSIRRGWKDFICREEMRKAVWSHSGGLGNQWPHGSGWKLSFTDVFCIAQGQRCLSVVDRHFLGRRSVSLANYHLLGPPAVCPSIPSSQ